MSLVRVDIPDRQGLVCGFVLRTGAAPVPFDVPPDPRRPLGAGGGDASDSSAADGVAVWLHFNLADARARRWVEACDRIPPAAREVLLSDDPHVRLAVTRGTSTARGGGGGGPVDAVAGVLGDLDYDFDGRDPEGLRVFRLYVDAACVVTGRRQPLRTMDRLRREVAGGLAVEGPAHLVAHLLEDLAEMFDAEVVRLADAVDDAEDRVLKGHGGGPTGADGAGGLGGVRRLLARLRRHVGAERQALHRALPRLPAWWGDADAARFRVAAERLDAVAQDLDLVQERARLVQEEVAGRVGQATNRNLYVLSIVTTIFLPITLITGVFGMNVGGLPWVASPAGFWLVVLVMFFTLLVLLLLLHWRRFF